MKTALKKMLSFIIVVCIAIIGVVTLPTVSAKAENNYVETSFGEGKFLITTTYNGATYYLPATTTSSAPKAMKFTNVNEISEDHLWTVTATATGSNYYIKNNAGKYLYATSDNNGIRVGGTNGSWTYNSSNNSFKYSNLNRFLGIYNAQDWRCYTTVDATNYKESSTSFVFYKLEEKAELSTETATALNAVDAFMSLSYKYTETTKTVEVSSEVTDTLNRALTGITGTNYKDWTAASTSNAVYKGQSAGGNDSIQLRSNNSNSGIVTTESGGKKVTKITVTWDSNTSNGRTLDIYGSNTAYTAATNLYNTGTQGTKLGSIVKGTSTELEITGDYAYIGLRSNSGAMYLSEIQIIWDSGSGGGTKTEKVLENSAFQLRCGVDASLCDIENIDGFGIRVSAGGKEKDYNDTAKSWAVDGVNAYVVINLGDIINDLDKLKTEFSVQAYVVVGASTYVSETVKTHSVASMVAKYHADEENQLTDEQKRNIEHLYNYLVEKEAV